MTRRQRLDDAGVAALKPKANRYTHADPELPGHYVRIQPNGSKSFVVVARDPRGKQHWRTIGSPPIREHKKDCDEQQHQHNAEGDYALLSSFPSDVLRHARSLLADSRRKN